MQRGALEEVVRHDRFRRLLLGTALVGEHLEVLVPGGARTMCDNLATDGGLRCRTCSVALIVAQFP